MKKLLFIIALVIASYPLSAWDFEAVSPSGHTLYYDIVQGGASVVGWNHSSYGTEPVHLTIPSVVNNGSVDLRVVTIGDNAFEYCEMLVSVEIPSSVRSIGSNAFYRCYGIGSFPVPTSVESIGNNAFATIPNVEYTGTAAGAPWGAQNLNAYHEGHYYYSDSLKTRIVCCERDATDAVIPPSVTSIGNFAFAFCFNISSVRIDSTITDMGHNAFSNCASLEEVFYNPQLSNNHEGTFTFSDCANLKHLVLGNSLPEICYRMCLNCTSLKEIVIPDNVTNVNGCAFMNCTSLESAVLGKGVDRTGQSMFEGCTGLISFTATDSLRWISSYTFRDCHNLRHVSSVEKVENIGTWAFHECRSLENIYWGKNLMGFGDEAFFNCSSLTEIVIPAAVSGIGDHAFSGCGNVARIVCMREASPTLGTGVFDSIDSGIEVIVPCDKESIYRRDSQWQRFDSIAGKKYYMVATTNNPRWGKAVVTRQPTCDDNTAVIEAVPEEGCRFVKWSNLDTDNPCQINYNGEGYSYRKAIFEPLVGIAGTEVLPGVKIYTSNGDIVIEGAAGETLRVFDIIGRQILTMELSSPETRILAAQFQKSGIYLFKVGTRKAEKIVLL